MERQLLCASTQYDLFIHVFLHQGLAISAILDLKINLAIHSVGYEA